MNKNPRSSGKTTGVVTLQVTDDDSCTLTLKDFLINENWQLSQLSVFTMLPACERWRHLVAASDTNNCAVNTTL